MSTEKTKSKKVPVVEAISKYKEYKKQEADAKKDKKFYSSILVTYVRSQLKRKNIIAEKESIDYQGDKLTVVEKKKVVIIDEEGLKQYLRNKGLFDRVVEIKETIDEKELTAVALEDEDVFEEVQQYLDTKTESPYINVTAIKKGKKDGREENDGEKGKSRVTKIY